MTRRCARTSSGFALALPAATGSPDLTIAGGLGLLIRAVQNHLTHAYTYPAIRVTVVPEPCLRGDLCRLGLFAEQRQQLVTYADQLVLVRSVGQDEVGDAQLAILLQRRRDLVG
jgi:hypothetical protein